MDGIMQTERTNRQLLMKVDFKRVVFITGS